MDLALIAAVTGPARLNALKKDFNGITPIHATILVGDESIIGSLRQQEGERLQAHRIRTSAGGAAANDHYQ